MSSAGKYSTKLQDARVLIFGGSSGIGFGIAEALLELGARVVLTSSSQERINGAISRLTTLFPGAAERVSGAACNLADMGTLAGEVSALFAQVCDGGRHKLDHVVFCAGDALQVRPLQDFSLAEMQQAGAVRFFAPLVISQQLRDHLNPGPASSFTLTTGGNVDRPGRDFSVMMSYLTGLHGMAKALAVDLGPMRVNCIGLGPVETEMWDGMKQAGIYEKFVANMEANMTTRTFGKLEDIVESYLYVMKDKNVTGAIINSNGGAYLTAGQLW